jgi:hypothetical protein
MTVAPFDPVGRGLGVEVAAELANSFIETFNGSLRDECLNVHWFTSLDEAKAIIEAWRTDYNESRPPHGSQRCAAGRIRPAAQRLERIKQRHERQKLAFCLVRQQGADHSRERHLTRRYLGYLRRSALSFCLTLVRVALKARARRREITHVSPPSFRNPACR